MKNSNVLKIMIRKFDTIAEWLEWIGYAAILIIILVTFVDVTGRYFFNRPLLGNIEFVQLAMAILGGFAILRTTAKKAHVRIDLLSIRFSRRVQVILYKVASLLGFLTMIFIAAMVFWEGAVERLKTGDYTQTLRLPSAPFEFVLFFGLFLASLVLLIQAFRPETEKSAENDRQGGGI